MSSFDGIQVGYERENLHLNHGPIDLLLCAEGEPEQVSTAYKYAGQRFKTILGELVQELPLLRSELSNTETATDETPGGDIARQMYRACSPYRASRLSSMAAVAGAVADSVLAAMQQNTRLRRCWVNNGGDIAFNLAPEQQFRCGVVADLGKADIEGELLITERDPVRGVATSGWATQDQGGRSFSLGIADAVTVLAENAASADVAATMIANQVDLPGHPGICREMAEQHDPDNDLGRRLVTTGVGPLKDSERDMALERGASYARELKSHGLIHFAILFLQKKFTVVGNKNCLQRQFGAS